MTRYHQPDPGFDPRVADWLEADPGDAPSQVLETVLAAVPSIPQRRAMRLPRRPVPMSRFAYLAAAVAAVAIVGIATLSGGLLNSPPPIGGVSPKPTDSTVPSVAPSPSPTIQRFHNGAIAMAKGMAIELIDPVTGRSTKTLSVDAPPSDILHVTDLSWAPDGRMIALSVGGSDPAAAGGVWVMDVSGGTSREILRCGAGPGGCSIAWSPDGTAIAVAHDDVLELLEPDGGNRKTVLTLRELVTGPTWSPDGTRIAFHSSQDGPGLFAVNRDGSDLTLLHGAAAGSIGTGDPAWSPDGSTIAYIGSTDLRVCRGTECHVEWRLHLMVLALDGSEPRELHPAGQCFCIGFGPSLTWAPDGASLAFVTLAGDGVSDGLFVIKADGTGLRHVTGDAGTAAWQPVR